MVLIKLVGEQAEIYKAWIAHFERLGDITYRERTEAFVHAKNMRWPS